MWNLNFKRNETNETKQTKRNKQMKHELFFECFVQCSLFLFAVKILLSVCQLASAAFLVKMTCRRVLAKPRRPVLFQNVCMPVNSF